MISLYAVANDLYQFTPGFNIGPVFFINRSIYNITYESVFVQSSQEESNVTIAKRFTAVDQTVMNLFFFRIG